MPYRPTDKGIFFTPRFSGANASIEIIFTQFSQAQAYIIEGRMSGLSTGTANGYFYTQTTGYLRSGYSNTSFSMIRADTGQALSIIHPNLPIKVTLGGIPAGKRISMLGTRFNIQEFFGGKIHSIKCTNWYMGSSNSGVDSNNGGLRADMHFQLDRILENDPTVPSLHLTNQYTPDVVSVPVAVQPQHGWLYSPDFRRWQGSTNNILEVGDSSISYEAGARPYHRLMRFTGDVNLNGNTGSFSWQRPQNVVETMPLIQGMNEFYVMVRANTLPTLIFSNSNGVTVTNLELTESHDAIVQVATWQKRAI